MSVKSDHIFERELNQTEYRIKNKNKIKGKLTLNLIEDEKQSHLKTLNPTINFNEFLKNKIIQKSSFPIFKRNRTKDNIDIPMKKMKTNKDITPSFYSSYYSSVNEQNISALQFKINQVKNENAIITKELNYLKKNYKLLVQENLSNKLYIEKLINKNNSFIEYNNSININKINDKEEIKVNNNYLKKDIFKKRNSSKSNSKHKIINKHKEDSEKKSKNYTDFDKKMNVLIKILNYFEEKYNNQKKLLEEIKSKNEKAKIYLNKKKLVNEKKNEIQNLLETKNEKEKEDQKLDNRIMSLNKMIKKIKENIKNEEKEVKFKLKGNKYMEEEYELYKKEKEDLICKQNKLDEQKKENDKDKNKIEEEIKDIEKILEDNKDIIKEKLKNEKELKKLELEENKLKININKLDKKII